MVLRKMRLSWKGDLKIDASTIFVINALRETLSTLSHPRIQFYAQFQILNF